MKPNKMTVGELIAKLQSFDPSLPVMVDGYEGGVDYPASIDKTRVHLDENVQDYYGSHEEDAGYYFDSAVKAVLIRR